MTTISQTQATAAPASSSQSTWQIEMWGVAAFIISTVALATVSVSPLVALLVGLAAFVMVNTLSFARIMGFSGDVDMTVLRVSQGVMNAGMVWFAALFSDSADFGGLAYFAVAFAAFGVFVIAEIVASAALLGVVSRFANMGISWQLAAALGVDCRLFGLIGRVDHT
ncbi:MAG: hypothetical protein AAFO77_13935 [Pseudomonadota bacterium]